MNDNRIVGPSQLLTFLASIVVLGCSSASIIQPAAQSKSAFEGAVYSGETTVIESNAGGEEFRVFHQAASGFVSVESVRQSADKRANDFCDKRGEKKVVFRETTSIPPHILGNFPRIELVFGCKEQQESPSDRQAKYDQIAWLKKLLDAKAITQEEFSQEKTKILGTP